ncbi:peptidoglycan/xylan/chitin deacetylase (PgdA/CDA1 family) [Nocardiopsis mwathae]|uniref:Peptidoglycan/xylan/chitin deacetylase (PgdA/CDA1 family) n=1 Tax=Nocardiopsis mwathae TaxID=1472723 RepID=A0A7W9YGE7_9ACTN|nr:polysaccharide deacetylase family protein [Nocardiopsis mwathae]MBB6171629.1 peptidoglycan/xylan/chitin deacetylase (PgdA/CDA1 family) [Nocardiopsis mwathae]
MLGGRVTSTPRSVAAGALFAALLAAAACTPQPAEPTSARASGEPSAEAEPRTIEDADYRVDTDDPVVFLTIDDGATRDPKMAEVLKDAGVKATFFLTDDYVRQDPDFFRELSQETGSAIENHTIDHPDLARASAKEQRRQICSTSDRYEEEFGRRPTLLRPPYGSFDDDTLRAAAECGATHVVHWSAEIDDGRIRFAAGDRLRPGDIVLMHFREQFSADIAAFVAAAEKSGLEPALLEDYLT